MKRKIAILLSAVMVASAMPMSAMAASTNSITDTVTVSSDEVVANAGSLTIKPTSTYNGGTFYIELANATFIKDKVEETQAQTFEGGQTFAQISETYTNLENWANAAYAAKNVESSDNPTKLEARIPYQLTYINSTTVAVQLLAVEGDYIESDDITNVFRTTPYAQISLANLIEAGSSGTITATIDGNSTGITSGTYTIGEIYSGSGSTTTTVSSVVTFADEGSLGTITIKENVAGSFAKGASKFNVGDVITLRLSSGFVFSNTASNITLKGTRNLSGEVVLSSSNVSVSDRTIKITIDENIANALTIDSSLTSSLAITGLKVEPEDEDKNYGTVKLTISSDSKVGITQETIEVATRQDEGLSMSLVDEATTIIAGRTYDANSDLDEDNFVTAKVRFSESYANAWGESRLDFTVPEGVQITGVEFTNADGFNDSIKNLTIDATNNDSSNYVALNGDIVITNNGRTLRFAKGFKSHLDTTSASSFDMVLKLSVVAGYEGDITLSASGAGASEGDIKDVVIAKAIQPISIETSSTNLNLGYTSYKTADISIIENVPGALIQGKDIEVSLDTLFGTEIAITDATVTTSSDELTISKVSVNSGSIVISISGSSYDNAATIKISDIQVGTTRSIPYGSYDLKVSGEAVINNYNETNNATASSKSNQNFAYNGNVSHYVIDDYINLVTSTGTLDNTVKVTIGEPTVLINDQAYDMDVAPYIQSASNSTLVPLRFVTVALGLDDVTSADESSKISFDANTKTATIYYGSGTSSKVIQFQAGSNIMNIAGTQIAMENGVTAEIKDGRMFVPFRALGQALGVSVSWDEETRTAIYNAN